MLPTSLLPPFSGQPVPRKEGLAKVSGQARYIDDLAFPGMIVGITVRSQLPRGILRSISFGGVLNRLERCLSVIAGP